MAPSMVRAARRDGCGDASPLPRVHGRAFITEGRPRTESAREGAEGLLFVRAPRGAPKGLAFTSAWVYAKSWVYLGRWGVEGVRRVHGHARTRPYGRRRRGWSGDRERDVIAIALLGGELFLFQQTPRASSDAAQTWCARLAGRGHWVENAK